MLAFISWYLKLDVLNSLVHGNFCLNPSILKWSKVLEHGTDRWFLLPRCKPSKAWRLVAYQKLEWWATQFCVFSTHGRSFRSLSPVFFSEMRWLWHTVINFWIMEQGCYPLLAGCSWDVDRSSPHNGLDEVHCRGDLFQLLSMKIQNPTLCICNTSMVL